MNNFSANYEKILDTLQNVEHKTNFINQIRKPKLSDIELISIDLTSEYMSIDSEYQLLEFCLITCHNVLNAVFIIEESGGSFIIGKNFVSE